MIRLPDQPRDVPWPTAAWPTGPALPRLESVLDRAFPAEGPQPRELGVSLATVVIRGGRLVAERYGPDAGPDTTLISWSTAKSITHALFGVLVRRGDLDVEGPAAVPEWSAPGDARGAITVDQLLRMSSGLAFVEDYVDDTVSDVIEMLFGSGRADVAHFAACKPLVAPPGRAWSYSSGTTNILTRLLGTLVGDGTASEGATVPFIQRELFDVIGMSSATARFDQAGTFIGSSFVYACARDFARFGLLYLRDGCWEGGRVLPPGWVDRARTPTPGSDGAYGAHWWIDPASPWGTFFASGYEGQYILVVPGLDAVVVRLGKSPADLRPAVEAWLAEAVDGLAAG